MHDWEIINNLRLRGDNDKAPPLLFSSNFIFPGIKMSDKRKRKQEFPKGCLPSPFVKPSTPSPYSKKFNATLRVVNFA